MFINKKNRITLVLTVVIISALLCAFCNEAMATNSTNSVDDSYCDDGIYYNSIVFEDCSIETYEYCQQTSEILESSSSDNINSVEEISERPSEMKEHEYEVYALAKIISAEAGNVFNKSNTKKALEAGISSDIWQQYVGYVVMNRVYQDYFPDTIEGVLYQNENGCQAYATETINKFEDNFYTEESLKNAKIVIDNYYNNTMPVPKNMVFQAEFEQGETFVNVGNTYFGLAPNLPSE